MDLAKLFERVLVGKRSKRTPDDKWTTAELAEELTSRGYSVCRQTIYKHLRPDGIEGMPTTSILRGYAEFLGLPVGLVSTAALVSAGLAEPWIATVVARLYELEQQGSQPANIMAVLDELAGGADNVVAMPVRADLTEEEQATMRQQAVAFLNQKLAEDAQGNKARRLIPRLPRTRTPVERLLGRQSRVDGESRAQ